MERSMFTSVSSRSASAYKRVGVETAVDMASPHQLVGMLYDGLLLAVRTAKAAMERGDVMVKCEQIVKAVRILDEGLKPALNVEEGGELAANLKGLYSYCVLRLTHANFHNDPVALTDVIGVIEPIAQGWKQIGGQHGA
jgi:flagellar protein FliS